MNIGTRYLWSKRWTRIMNSALSIKMCAKRKITRAKYIWQKYSASIFLGIMFATVVVFVCGVIFALARQFQPVPAEALEKRVHDNPCLKIALADNVGVIRYEDLSYAEDQCKNANLIVKQRQVLGVR